MRGSALGPSSIRTSHRLYRLQEDASREMTPESCGCLTSVAAATETCKRFDPKDLALFGQATLGELALVLTGKGEDGGIVTAGAGLACTVEQTQFLSGSLLLAY